MLIGEYQHTIDIKGRVNFPAKLRETLGDNFVITRGLDGCLFVYSKEGWSEMEQKIRGLPMAKSRTMQRFFFAGAAEMETDKQGRVVIPANLREYAHLEKDIMIVGASTRAEIWDMASWSDSFAAINSDDVAELMNELGF